MTDKADVRNYVGVAPLWDRGGMTNDSTVRANAPGKSFRKAMTLAEATHEFPDDKAAAEQRLVAAEVLAECRRVGIPLLLEPLFYDLDDPSDRHRVVIETCWPAFECGYHCTRHLSGKQLDSCVAEFGGCHTDHPLDTVSMIQWTAEGIPGKRLNSADLVAL